MSPFLRKVKTASGATAVQIVEKKRGVRTILEHLGSAHDEAQLAALMRVGQDKLHANQPTLDLPAQSGVRPPDLHTSGQLCGFAGSSLLVKAIWPPTSGH